MTTPVDKNELRRFGLTLSLIFVGACGIIIPIVHQKPVPTWPWVAGGLFFIPALIRPLWLKTVYAVWMAVGNVLGWINTRIILGIIFFLLITPLGVCLRLMGKDFMNRHFDKRSSYRTMNVPQPISHMEKPF